MSANAQRFDHWIRSSFTEINTELEELYFAQGDRSDVSWTNDKLRQSLHDEGRSYLIDLNTEDNTATAFESALELLGNVGLYMSACRRHELTEPSREQASPLTEASGLAMHIGASLGVAPRFAASHISTHNHAQNGVYRSFTRLDDELLFLDYNTRGIFAYKRAADALVRTVPLGITHPVTSDLLRDARRALEDVAASNDHLFEELDAERFFHSVRPYYQSYRVGKTEYRGANTADFPEINELDLLLGLCQAEDSLYSQFLVDKRLYMMPTDQARLQDCMRRTSLMNQILACLDSSEPSGAYFEENAALFLDVCEAHGKTASQHHDQLVKRFIEQPASRLREEHAAKLAAIGPPLDVSVEASQKLRDMRIAARRSGISSRHRDLDRIREALALVPRPA
ncbi:MAG: monodechloroaminopyrrolnitrin synthase PrnB family protein [Congregibacter sp.]